MLPPIILSIYWDDPKKLACCVVITNGTEGEVKSFISILRRKIERDQIFGVPRLIGEIQDIAKHAFTFTVLCFDQSTIFMNEVV